MGAAGPVATSRLRSMAKSPLTIPDNLRQLAKVRRPQSRDNVPTSRSGEPVFRSAAHVVAFGNVGETFVSFGVEHWV